MASTTGVGREVSEWTEATVPQNHYPQNPELFATFASSVDPVGSAILINLVSDKVPAIA